MEAWDVVVVGSGIAALRAAIAVADAEASVTLLSSQALSSTTDYAVNCGFSAPLSEPNQTTYFSDTIRIGVNICESDVVTSTIASSLTHLAELERWGLVLRRDGNGLPHLGKLPGQSTARTASTGDSTVHELVQILEEQCIKRRIPRRGDIEILDIVLTDGGSRGLIAMDIQSGDIFGIQAKSIILADSGYEGAWNGDGVGMGNAASLALRSDIPLADLEFISMHPLTVADVGLHLPLDLLGAGGVVVGADGTPLSCENGPDALARDILSAGGAALDLTGIPRSERAWYGRTHSVLKNRCGIAAYDELIPLSPSVTHTIGGIMIDSSGQVVGSEKNEIVSGLYAAGDAACSGLHGASVNSGDLILSAISGGAAAGQSAANHASTTKFSGSSVISTALSEAHHMHDQTLSSAGNGGIASGTILNTLSSTMKTHMGHERDGTGLAIAAAAIQELSNMTLGISDSSPVMNTELISMRRTIGLLDVAAAAVSAAITREESRGTHVRTDHPDIDAKFEKHSLSSSDGTVASLALRD